MASMDENDIIITITEYLRLNSKDGEIAITPAELDEQLKLPAGSVEKHTPKPFRHQKRVRDLG